jgi:GWxTD domain-containing protein
MWKSGPDLRLKRCVRGLAAIALLAVGVLRAAAPDWLNAVAPIITPAEKKTYLSLPAGDRVAFEERFWSARSIDREEYYRRIEYIDAKFGSSKRASGANTDPGRVYLSLGAPARIVRVPSSRIFVPLEIWYYDSIPEYLNTELRLIFYQPNSVGTPKLYSPTVDTIRVLLLPEASTVHMFGPNDSVTESDIRQNLKTGPAEDEVITAAGGIASGIKYSGNDEILGRITSPDRMLAKPQSTQVTSRFITARPELDVLKSVSFHGAAQIDLRLVTAAQREIGLELLQGFAIVYNNRLKLGFSKAETIEYTHRLDLLPGSYRLIFSVDGKMFAYALEIPEKPGLGEICRANPGPDTSGRHTPFEFGGKQIVLNPTGRMAVVSVPEPGTVTWVVREDLRIVWRTTVGADRLAMVELPALPPGAYHLEAATDRDSQNLSFTVPTAGSSDPKATLVSFNANLTPAQRLAFIGNQWLLRGRSDRARQVLAAALAAGDTKDAQIALARLDAMSGNLDVARDRVRGILAVHPDDFEALAVFAYIETEFQDYPVATELYRKALAVQDSPALRVALAKLPTP